ncbi:hypothetical protein FXO38_21949 [Capsicum annuum]|uniref:Aconitase/3-isopropylmalate dehydratase large subunit alpha/beta/alpha domain-containing protein n=1 Tax=Capsicum annuum TaxID=4072 RepID=A0A2G2ZMX6_CAPAN|nr:hypothetical protein FXO37_30725 [Capsicum annuum]KAF3640786.1 hypothetical protein FXO38_21949 [Capsicum annuum]PHT83350.1 hypothetical protein T459_11793 [Capsicum annuum]
MKFVGTIVESLTMKERMTLCNMVIEGGGKNGVIPAAKKKYDYLRILGMSRVTPIGLGDEFCLSEGYGMTETKMFKGSTNSSDIILNFISQVIGEISMDGATHKTMEFVGTAVESLILSAMYKTMEFVGTAVESLTLIIFSLVSYSYDGGNARASHRPLLRTLDVVVPSSTSSSSVSESLSQISITSDADSDDRIFGLGGHYSFKKVGRVSSDYSEPREVLDKMLAEDDEMRSPTTKEVILDSKINTSSSIDGLVKQPENSPLTNGSTHSRNEVVIGSQTIVPRNKRKVLGLWSKLLKKCKINSSMTKLKNMPPHRDNARRNDNQPPQPLDSLNKNVSYAEFWAASQALAQAVTTGV